MPEIFRNYIEHSLLSSIQKRDKKDFAVLYDKYSGILLSVAKRVVDNDKLAEDVLLKSFLQIWDQIESYSALDGSLLLWMIRITKKEAFAHFLQHQNKENKPENGDLIERIYYKGQACTDVAQELAIDVATLHKMARVEMNKLREGIVAQ